MFCVDGTVETKHLLQLGIEESVQSGKHCRHDRCHALFRGVEGCACKPSGFVRRGKVVHQDLKAGFLALSAGREKLLHQLEHGHDMPLFVTGTVGRNVFGKEQND